jgi:hypothetical protein
MRYGYGYDYSRKRSGTIATVVSNVSITGNPVVGQLLTVSYDITGPASVITRVWKRNGVTISTSTVSDTYPLGQNDAGNASNILCNVDVDGVSNADSNTIVRIMDALADAWIGAEIITSAERDSANQLFLDIRAVSYHTELDNRFIYANINQNLANKSLFGSNVAVPVNSPTWTRAVGYTMTGTSYINRGTSTNVKFTRNNHTLVVEISNKNILTLAAPMGGMTAGTAAIYFEMAANVNMNSLSMQDNAVFVRTIANKDYGIRRSISTEYIPYQDGVAAAAKIRTTTGTPATLLFDGAYNNNGAVVEPMESGSIVVGSAQGSAVVDPAVLRTIINTFIASL